MTSPVILVEGTWGGDWAQPGSAFRAMLVSNGFEPIRFQGWSLTLAGVPNILARFAKFGDFEAGGYALSYFLKSMPYEHRNLVTHSYGIGPVIFAAALTKIRIRSVVDVCSPVRADLLQTASGAVEYIGQWRHISSHAGDKMQRFAGIFDGHVGFEYKWHVPGATNLVNMTVPNIGHSKLFKPEFFDLWELDGLLDMLRAPSSLNMAG